MYQAFYRKFRPAVFRDVVGQQYIVQALKNQVELAQTGHAYIFAGVRGTGKTTCARIFAKAINCLNPQHGDPCNECGICKGIDSGSILDIEELDAASNNGVDYVRELRQEIEYAPTAAKYRVYIIDEAHMLSGSAFNALLKTLEEPPPHAKFILATTEANKLPVTILSRCQRYDFRRIEQSDIVEAIQKIAEIEAITLEPQAAMMIASAADGAMRDAQSLLELCAGSGKTIDAALVERLLGLASMEYISELVASFVNQDTKAAFECFDRIYADGADPVRLCRDLLDVFREMLLLRTAGRAVSARYQKLADHFTENPGVNKLMQYIKKTQDCFERLSKSISPRLEVEMLLLELSTAQHAAGQEGLAARITVLEKKLATLSVSPVQESKPTETPKPKKTAAPAEPLPDESSEPGNDEVSPPKQQGSAKLFDGWLQVLAEAKTSAPSLYGLLEDSTAYADGDKLMIASPKQLFAAMLKQENNIKELRELMDTALGNHGFNRLSIYKPAATEQNVKPQPSEVDNLLQRAAALNIKTEIV